MIWHHPYLKDIVAFGSHKGLEKTRYVNDKQITDHYAIIPTGQGLQALKCITYCKAGIRHDCQKVFEYFLSSGCLSESQYYTKIKEESFFSNFKVLAEEGYLKVVGTGNAGKQDSESDMDMNFF